MHALVVSIALLVPPASAQVVHYYTEMDSAQNGVDEPGTGWGEFTIDLAANTLDYHIEYQGTLNPESASHIHGPAVPHTDAPIVHFLPIGSPKIGTWNYPQDVEADLLAGRYYVNIHSHTVLVGEMRGQILPRPERSCACSSNSPCGNDDPNGGCRNSTGSGARIEHAGLASVILDTFSPRAEHVPPGQFGLFFIGPNAVSLPFGDGIRCVGGATRRLTLSTADASGVLTQAPGIAALVAPLIDPGETWRMQAWFRDPQGPCGGHFNLSDALAVTFGD